MSVTMTYQSPCVHYTISQSTSAAVCRLHNNLPPDPCPCADYSSDYGVYGSRLNRWASHLMWNQPNDLRSAINP